MFNAKGSTSPSTMVAVALEELTVAKMPALIGMLTGREHFVSSNGEDLVRLQCNGETRLMEKHGTVSTNKGHPGSRRDWKVRFPPLRQSTI